MAFSLSTKLSHPHDFEVHTYKSPHFCDFCGEFIWGLVRQGIKCNLCGMSVHKRCGEKVGNDCVPNCERAGVFVTHSLGNSATPVAMILSEKLSTITLTRNTALDEKPKLPHTFDEFSTFVVSPEFDKCDVCGGKGAAAAREATAATMLEQSVDKIYLLKCRDCGLTCHKQCQVGDMDSCQPSTSASEPTEMTSSTGDDSDSEMAAVEPSSTINRNKRPQTKSNEPDEGSNKNQLPLMSISASIKRKSPRMTEMDQVSQRTGWMICYTSRGAPHKRYYWRLDTRGISMHPSEDPASEPLIEINLDNVVAVEEAMPLGTAAITAQELPHVFTIRMPAIIYYCGEDPTLFRQLPDRSDIVNGCGREYGLAWMKSVRELCTVLPSNNDTVNIRDLYHIHNESVLGSGQFGVVFVATSVKDGKECALKVIDASRVEKRKLLPEIRILKGINHPGIVRLIDVHYNEQKIYVCMEKLEKDMLDLILSSPQSRLTERKTKFINQQICTALKYLHTNYIVHCDLKPENVLLVSEDAYPQIKLCDFGFSRIIGEKSFRQSIVGTPAYLAPEALSKRPRFNKALDMWSLGVIIYVSLSGTFPYNTNQDIASQIRDAAFLFPGNPWSEMSRDSIDLIRSLMDDRVYRRPTCQQTLKHDWFAKDYAHWCDLRALEARLEASTGRSTRWWTDENDDEQWEQLRAEQGLPVWQAVGCKFEWTDRPTRLQQVMATFGSTVDQFWDKALTRFK